MVNGYSEFTFRVWENAINFILKCFILSRRSKSYNSVTPRSTHISPMKPPTPSCSSQWASIWQSESALGTQLPECIKSHPRGELFETMSSIWSCCVETIPVIFLLFRSPCLRVDPRGLSASVSFVAKRVPTAFSRLHVWILRVFWKQSKNFSTFTFPFLPSSFAN